MLGEIIKSSEALRYHAKTAEIAGQNLAHVNDESYARQRVLSRDGLMSKGQGGLNVGSLEAGGIEHFRNELLDKRVFAEFSESANLEAQKEILSLLQAALGESIDRQSVSGGLDNDYESNLAAGGLARALDDLFNAFQELSASPDEATAKEEIVNKIKTLTKRFNDAGSAIDEIDSDLSNSVEKSVNSVNRLLDQIYEVNLQIKRFELLGQGQAVTYRDQRQSLLEDLSKLINFKVQPEIDADSQKETGFWNLSTLDHQNQVVDLVSSATGVVPLSKDFGKLITLNNASGENAQVQAKISVDGSLGHIEVLDGGSQYDDTDGPILFAVTPPLVASTDENNTGLSISDHRKGEVFSQGGKLYQTLSDSLAGVSLTDDKQFLEITNTPENGVVFPESFRKYSDLESFDKGEQIYYEGKLYQTTDSVGPSSELKVNELNQLTNNLVKGEVVQLNDQFFQVMENLQSGLNINILSLPELEIGEELNGLLSLGGTPPQEVNDLSYVPSVVDANRPDRWFLTKSYKAGDIVKYEDKFLEFTQDVFRGSELDEMARAMQALTYDQSRSYFEGDFVELGGSYYKFTNNVSAFADEATVASNLSEIIGGEDQPFDDSVKVVEDPNWHFIKENGSFKISEAFREYQLSGISGSEQTKQFRISGLAGDPSDVFDFEVKINGEKVVFDGNLTDDDPSFSINGFSGVDFSGTVKNKLLEINSSGKADSGTSSANPAFDVLIDDATGDLLVTGVSGLGDFELVVTPQNNAPEGQGDVVAAINVTNERDYIADNYNIVFTSDSFDPITLSVPFKGDPGATSQAIADAVANNEILNQSISVLVNGGDLTFRAKKQGFDFIAQLAEVNGLQDLHNDANNQIKKSTELNLLPSSKLIQDASEGIPVSVRLNNFDGQELVEEFKIVYPQNVDFGEQFLLNLTLGNNQIPVEIPAQNGRTIEELLTQTENVLLSIEKDGTFVQGVQADDPAFVFAQNLADGEIKVSGSTGLGEFNLTQVSNNFSINALQDFNINQYKIIVVGKSADLGSVTVDYQGTEEATVKALEEAINNDDTLKNEVLAVADGTNLEVIGLTPNSDFSNLRWDSQASIFEPNPVSFNLTPKLPLNQVLEISNLDGVEQVKSATMQFVPGQFNELAIPLSLSINGNEIDFELPASNDPLDPSRFESVLTSLQSINKDGSLTTDGSASVDPAFSVAYIEESFTFLLSGNPGAGDFQIGTNGVGGVVISNEQNFLSDDITVLINDDEGTEIGNVTVASFSDPKANAKSLISAINQDANLSQSVKARLSADGEKVLIEGVDPTISFTTSVAVDDKLNPFTVTQIEDLDASKTASLQASGAQIKRIEKSGVDAIGLVTTTAQLIDFKKQEDPMVFLQNDLFYFNGDDGEAIHFVVTAATGEVDPAGFDPLDVQWENNFKVFKPKLVNPDDPSLIFKKAFPVGHNLENGSMVELNIGLAEAVVRKGEITGFNILNQGNGLPSNDAVFANGQELLFDSGAIKGYQDARSTHLETFRTELNGLVSNFVEEINSIYNPNDKPGGYVFGFDAILTRPVAGHNLLMEEEYGYFGREGDASITLYRDEVDMTLPSADSEDFSIVNTTPIFPEEFAGDTIFYRGGDVAETTFRADDAGDLISFYASASKMQNVTMENDEAYPGADLMVGTQDDGRSLMMAYETIPFRIDGLEDGAKLPIIGDNFSFSALPSNPWNLASSLKVDQRFTSDSLLSDSSNATSTNEVALAIAEMGNGSYIEKVALINANMGNTIADLNDNIDHQKSIESLLLDQRRAVSSVSIDEEVADLMRFQRSFQASSRVLSTLDKMLEIVVMGLVR